MNQATCHIRIQLIQIGGQVTPLFEIQSALNPPEVPNKSVTPVELTPYTNAIAALKNPAQWTNPDAAQLFPSIQVSIITTGKAVEAVARPQLNLENVTRRAFTLQFKAYIVDDPKLNTGRNFQINFLTWNRSFFVEKPMDANGKDVEIADRFGKTGYFIRKFERKIGMVEVPGITSKMEQDLSELTVQHEGEDPIVLVLGRVAAYPKRYARIQYTEGTGDFCAGDTFESGGKTYKVVDIADKEVVIVELKSGEKQTLSLTPVVPTQTAPTPVTPRQHRLLR